MRARSRHIVSCLLVLIGVSCPEAQTQTDSGEDETVLREAEKIQRSMVNLIGKIRQSTVSVIRYHEVEENGKKVEKAGGLGSGIVVNREGRVFTNVHVVAKASRIELVFSDGSRADAEIFNEMPLYDFALLKVQKRNLKPAEFAKTSLVEPGQWSIACGNPRGLAVDGEPIPTLGIVSGLGRVAGGNYKYHNAVQTDAEINPGNSGGPLFDLDGRVIGINGLISTVNDAKTNVGVGFSIPGDQIRSFLPSLLSGEPVKPGYSGLVVGPSKDGKKGVIVKNVSSGSPASKVGIKPGDRITRVNNNAVDNSTTWANTVAMLPNGKKISIRLERKGKTYVKTFTLQLPKNNKR